MAAEPLVTNQIDDGFRVIKKVVEGAQPKDVEDEIDFVEGCVGEPEFSARFAELVKPRFGSVEQFQAAYPRIVLDEVK